MDGRSDFAVVTADGGLLLVFPGALLLSLNIMLRMHDAKATSLKSTWSERVRALLFTHAEVFKEWASVAQYPVVVEEVYITPESALLDTESVAASCKPIIDSLVRNGILPDDSCGYVAQPIPYSERGPLARLVLKLKPVPKPWGLIDDCTVAIARGESNTIGSV